MFKLVCNFCFKRCEGLFIHVFVCSFPDPYIVNKSPIHILETNSLIVDSENTSKTILNKPQSKFHQDRCSSASPKLYHCSACNENLQIFYE